MTTSQEPEADYSVDDLLYFEANERMNRFRREIELEQSNLLNYRSERQLKEHVRNIARANQKFFKGE